ncbi:putative molybdenum carrier [bacterium BMS3Bbin14]|nr:putative molybdenum carrier [bacterium BMS3Abin13]GBE53311.1 putative molybdenum carrier [bacterium BMS3Bbin14]HDO31376.1 hypothetical protein [Desulfobacteraceae bacterium]
MKIISGGQTGADRAALDAARELELPHGGWLPRGRKTENGPLPRSYPLEELDSSEYRPRTEKNILASDGTLIVSFGPLRGGSALTESLARRHDRPCLHINLEETTDNQAVASIMAWLRRNRIATLNVAGPRASGEPRIYQAVLHLLKKISWQELDQGTAVPHHRIYKSL